MKNRFVALALLILATTAILSIYTRRARQACVQSFPPQNFVHVDEGRLHYVEAGTGSPVVLIHGDGGSFLDFTLSPLFARLAEEYHVIAFDRPGHGYSEAARGDGNVVLLQADMLHQALRQLRIEQPLLVGHSRGGSIVAAYLTQYPRDVAAAVSLAGDFYGGKELGWFYHLGAVPLLGRLLVDTVYMPLIQVDDHALLRGGLGAAFAPESPVPPDYLRGYSCMWNQGSNVAGAVAELKAANRLLPRLAGQYESLDVPLVIVHGEADRSVPVEEATRLHEEVGPSALLLAEGGSHELQFTRPEMVLEAVRLAWQMGEDRSN